jgi:DNA-binding response OmpR family regulator
MRVLVADSDKAIASFVKRGLESESYAVDVVDEGEEARYMATEYDYDLLILDRNLPRIDGFRVLKEVRAKKLSLPILILSVRASVDDRVKCLNEGADDYVTKPFSFSEVSARVRALLRRSRHPSQLSLVVEDLGLNRADHMVKRAERRLELTPKEFALLEYLMRNAGHLVSRAMIVEHVWDLSFDTMTNVVEVYIHYLRKKVDKGFDRKLIHTVRGVGYRLGDLPGIR